MAYLSDGEIWNQKCTETHTHKQTRAGSNLSFTKSTPEIIFFTGVFRLKTKGMTRTSACYIITSSSWKLCLKAGCDGFSNPWSWLTNSENAIWKWNQPWSLTNSNCDAAHTPSFGHHRRVDQGRKFETPQQCNMQWAFGPPYFCDGAWRAGLSLQQLCEVQSFCHHQDTHTHKDTWWLPKDNRNSHRNCFASIIMTNCTILNSVFKTVLWWNKL